MRAPAVILGALLACSCSAEVSFFLERPWPEDQPVLLLLAGEDDQIFEARILPPEPVQQLSLERQGIGRIYARTHLQLPRYHPLESCTVLLEGSSGTELGAVSGAWISTPFDLAAGGKIVLEEERDPRPFTVRIVGCAREPLSCDVISTFGATPPTDYGMHSVAAISTTIALAGSIQEDGRSLLLRIQTDTATIAGVPDGARGVLSLERRGSIVLGAAGRSLFALDPLGRVLTSTTLGFAISDISVGIDDTAMVIGTHGELAVVSADNRRVTVIDTPRYSTLLEDYTRIAVWSAERMILVGPDQSVHVFDGLDWSRELGDLEEIDVIALDGDSMLVVPKTGELLIRSQLGEWASVGNPFLATHASRGAALGDGRYFLVGQSGTSAYYNGEAVCAFGLATGQNFEGLDFAPGGRFGYAVGENNGAGTPGALVRLEIPE